MTYGAAIPRFKPRPTLDNLREPLVPFQSSITSNQYQYQSPTQSIQSSKSPNSRDYPCSSNSHDSYEFQEKQSNANSKKNKPTNNLNKKEKPTTDIFGYTSAPAYKAESRPEIEDDNDQPYSLSRAKSAPINNRAPVQQQVTSSDKKDKQPEKTKSRLHLSLGKLRKSKEQKSAEPARLRDITEIRIANPTFTRENLSARNYDAFFESGVPVYSLQCRTPVTEITEPGPDIDKLTKRPHSLGIFNKMSKSTAFSTPVETMHARSRSTDPMALVPQKGDRCHSLD